MFPIIAALLLQTAEPASVLLSCAGTSTFIQASTTSITSDRDVTQSASVSSSTRGALSEAATVELVADGGRLRVPAGVQPNLTSGGSNGWWPLYDVKVTPELLTARVRLNLIDKPKVSIDRRTGEIRIAGLAGSFTGACRRVQAEPLF